MQKITLVASFLFAISFQVHAKISTPEQYMAARTKIASTIPQLNPSQKEIGPKEYKALCSSIPTGLKALTRLNNESMHLFPADAKKVLVEENAKNHAILSDISKNVPCAKLAQQFKN